MLSSHSAARKRSTRSPFLVAPWDEHHQEFRRIDAELPPDHHARWLACAVARLDLAPLRAAYANRGSLAYPPELLLAFVLFMYARKLTSPASWLEESRRNDSAKWLLRGLRPARCTFYTFLARLAPFLDSWHKLLVAWAVAEGLTSARSGSLDGTFVAALASRHRLLSGPALDGRALLLWLAVRACVQPAEVEDLACGLLATAACFVEPALLLLALLLLVLVQLHRRPEAVRGLLPAWLPQTVVGRVGVLERLLEARRLRAERLAPLAGKERLSKKDEKALAVKVNPSDPEAALGFDKLGTYRPMYNLLLVKATDANLVLAWDLVSRNNDDGLLKPMMERTEKQLGHHLEETLIDGGFVSIDGLLYCEKHSITLYAPLAGAGQAGWQEEKAKDKQGASGKESVKKYGKEEFRYDGDKRQYECPAGKVLKEVYRTTEKLAGGVELPVLVHRAEASDCAACGQRGQCTSGKQGRVVKRYEGEQAVERLRTRMAEPASQESYRRRKQTVEPGYAELKEHRGLREFRCFGRLRSRCQAGLTILATNALSIARALLRRASTAQPPPPNDFQAA